MQGVDLSPVGLFLGASLVGKAVMAVLFLASLWCWVLIIEGVVSVVRLRRAVRQARAGGPLAKSLTAVAAAGDEEARRRIPGETVGELRSRISDAMARAARELLTRSEGGLPNLAVISSVAPFVGLFGTVWGIMSSFAAIGQSQDTSLATVAPGIAESLAATAYGLAAAIPASIGYNRIGAAYAPARTGHGLVRRRARARAARPSGRSRARRRAAPPRRDALMAMSPRKIGEGLYQPLADINVTPLVDVMLVLLIIFMVTAPMLATGIKVNLPSAKTAQPLENKEPVIVVVAKDGAAVGRKRPGVARRAGGEGQGQAWRLQRRRSVARRPRRVLWRRRVGDGRTRGQRNLPDRHRVRPAPHRLASSGRAERADLGRAERAGAVTVATLDGRVFEPPPVRPPWLRPLVIADRDRASRRRALVRLS